MGEKNLFAPIADWFYYCKLKKLHAKIGCPIYYCNRCYRIAEWEAGTYKVCKYHKDNSSLVLLLKRITTAHLIRKELEELRGERKWQQ